MAGKRIRKNATIEVRVSCFCCANKNLKELKAIYKFLPEYWQKKSKTYKQRQQDR